MSVAQVLLYLTGFAWLSAVVMALAVRWRGLRGLLVVTMLSIALTTSLYFTMEHKPGTVTPSASSMVAAAATIAVAIVVWRRRALSTGSQRVRTILGSVLAFHALWLALGVVFTR